MYTMHTNYFYGNKVSEYGIQHHRVDYGTLAKAFDCVLNNEIMQKTYEIGYWEQESGFVDNTEEIEELENRIYEVNDQLEILSDEIDELEENGKFEEAEKQKEQYKIYSNELEELEEQKRELEEEQEDYPECYQFYIVSDNGARILKEINEIVWYNEELDMYIWGVTHFGTSWDYVLTDIKIVDHTEN